jgi:hypothetical protein
MVLRSDTAFRRAKYSSFVAAVSFGKCPRVLITRRSIELSDSIALVV